MNRRFCPLPAISSAMILLSAIAVLATTAAAQSPDSKPTPKLGPAKVTISKETTYLTVPLRPDGWIDFAAVINEKCGEGVAPENNAAIPFWRAVGPNDRDWCGNAGGKQVSQRSP